MGIEVPGRRRAARAVGRVSTRTSIYLPVAGRCWAYAVLGVGVAPACGEALPSDVANYRTDPDCHQMNVELLPQRSDDPHEGEKNVFACNVPLSTLQANERPFPDGSVVIKESIRKDSDFAWLVATARKSKGGWTWNEYSRNFENEAFLEIFPSEQVCIDCHEKARTVDWIYTAYTPR